MKAKHSLLAKALTVAISSTVLLAACEKNETTSVSTQTQQSVKQNQLERVKSESLFADYAQMRSKQVSDISYNLQVKIGNKSEVFSGTTDINFTLADDNQNDLTIDFDSGNVESVLVNGKPASFNYEQWFITIPKDELNTGKNTIKISYQRPYATDGSGLHRFVDPENGEVYLYTDFEPYDANKLFPHFDQPDLKATYTMQVTAPKHWQIISSTRETSIKEMGENKLWSFPTSAKFSSYVFSLHAGNYAVWEDSFEDIPLRVFARQSLAKYINTEEWFTPTKQSFGFYNKYFDVKYPFGKYDQVVAPDFNAGAMENVAAVTFSETYISRGEKSTQAKMSLANVIAHEMAHMWFGDLVTMRWWNGLWLNESFATYMANLAVEKASDFENLWDVFYSGTKQWAYSSDDSVNTHAIELPVPSTGDAMSNFDGITYGKGASVLKQLPYYLGEENFRLGVSNYLKKFSYKNTDLDDFIGELGKAAGKDMSEWTQDWLYNAGKYY
ncbi:M1 family metallopeptidase [Thalassotalea piscium]